MGTDGKNTMETAFLVAGGIAILFYTLVMLALIMGIA